MSKVLRAIVLTMFAVSCGPNWIIPEPPDIEADDSPAVDGGSPGCPIEVPYPERPNQESSSGTPIPPGSFGNGGIPVWRPDAGPESVDGGRVVSGDSCLCHIPKNKPDSAHTICVGEPAFSVHLSHGDYPGPCVGGD